MAEQFRTLIITAADAPASRAIAMCFGPGGVGMWDTGLSPTGLEPATHFVSSGFVPEGYAMLSPCTTWTVDESGAWVQVDSYPGNAALVASYAAQAGIALTETDVEGIFSRSDVSEQEPFVAFARLGLKIVNPPEAADA